MLKKDELYNKSLKQFISILANIKLQMKLNPERAESNIDDVIALLRKQILIPEVKGDFRKKVNVGKVPQTVAENFVSADKIKEAEET